MDKKFRFPSGCSLLDVHGSGAPAPFGLGIQKWYQCSQPTTLRNYVRVHLM